MQKPIQNYPRVTPQIQISKPKSTSNDNTIYSTTSVPLILDPMIILQNHSKSTAQFKMKFNFSIKIKTLS